MNAKKIFLVFYTIISLILIADIALVKKLNISFAGNTIDLALYSGCVISTLILVFISLKGHVRRLYLVLVSVFLVLTVPFWIVLFLTTGLNGSNVAKSLNGHYRVQVINQLTYPNLEILKVNYPFEEVIATDPCRYLFNPDLKTGHEMISSVKFIKETPDSLFLQISTPWRKHIKSYRIKK